MEVFSITPIATLALGHRAYFLRTGVCGHIVAATLDGTISVAGPTHALLASISLRRSLSAVSIAPNGDLLAVALDDRVLLLELSGNVIRELPGSVLDVWFDSSSRLWTARRKHDLDDILVTIRDDPQQAHPTLECEVEDPFGESDFVFPSFPSAGSVPTWIAAGQDGQVLAWIERTGSDLCVEILDDFEACLPPAVSPDGDEFLLPTDRNEVRRYDMQTLEQIDTLSLGSEDDPILTALYLSPTDALLSTQNGMTYRLDVDAMTVQAQVIVTGHEPRLTKQLYPSLDDADECTDLFSIFFTGGAEVVSAHTVLPDPDFVQHSLLVWWGTARAA